MPDLTLHLRGDQLSSVRKESLSTSLFVLGVTATAALALASRTQPASDLVKSAVIVVVAAIVAIGLDLKRKREVWQRFQVQLTDEKIRTQRPGGIPRELARAQVRHVVATSWPARGLVVRGPAALPPVFVPAALERFDEVRAILGSWKPIETSRVPDLVARLWPVAIVVVCALEALAIGDAPPALVAAASALLIVIALWSVSNVLRSHRLSVRARALSLLLLVPAGYLAWRIWDVLR